MASTGSTDDVQLTDLEVIQQFSLAVRGATAPRGQVIAALESDLAYLRGARRANEAATSATARSEPAKRAPAKKAPAKVATRAAVKKAPAGKPASKAARRA